MAKEKKSDLLGQVTDKTRALALICIIVEGLFLASLPAFDTGQRIYPLLVSGLILIVIAVGIVQIELAEKRVKKIEGPNIPEKSAQTNYPSRILMAAETNRNFEINVLSLISNYRINTSLDTLFVATSAAEEHSTAIRETQAMAIAALMRDLGFITIDANGRMQPVSELAACFMKSMALHLEEHLDFIGGWTAQGRNNPKAQIPRSILRAIEERRVTELGERKAKPIRFTRAALVLIKAQREDNEDVYLTQLSDSWGTAYYWFIGGIMEKDDNSIEACAFRELAEELALKRSDFVSLNLICQVSDRRISERLGVLTEYDYQIFYAQLVSDSAGVKAFRPSSHKVKTYHGMVQFTRNNRWRTWSDISSDPQMQAHAAAILTGLKQEVGKLPYSVSWKVLT